MKCLCRRGSAREILVSQGYDEEKQHMDNFGQARSACIFKSHRFRTKVSESERVERHDRLSCTCS